MRRLSHLMTKVFLDIPITLQLITEQGKQTITLSNPDELNTIHKERLYNKNPASNYTNLPLFHWFANILVCLIWWSLTTGNQLRWFHRHLPTWQRIKPCDNIRASWYGSDGCMSPSPDTCISMIWWLRSKRICNLDHWQTIKKNFTD